MVGNIMSDYKKKNPRASNDKMIEAAALKIADGITKSRANGGIQITGYDDYDNLITKNLGPTEKQVFNSDPYQGALVLSDAKLALDSAKANYSDLHNGKGDAYRHGLWQGLSAFHTSISYAKAFGDAHEKDFPGPAIETEMDLYNNYSGRLIGDSKWIITSVYSGVKDGINKGKFKYIKNGKLVWTNQ